MLSQLVKIFEKAGERKRVIKSHTIKNKADAYDKLQKAIKARRRVNSFDNNANLMSDDGYKRKG